MKNIIDVLLRNNIIEHLLFLVLAVFSFNLFEERLVADSSYYIFRVINNECFWVEHNRYILILSQILPLVGIKLGLSLKFVLYLYSIGHVVFFYSIFLIARYLYKNKYSGVLLLFIQTLGIMSGFFVPMFELYYSAGLLVLVSSIINYSYNRYNVFILAFLSFFILTSHFYSYILLLFILALHVESYKLKHIKYYLMFIAFMVGVFIFKKFNTTEYEEGKIKAFLYTLEHAEYNTQYLKSLISFLIEYYKELLFLKLTVIAYFLVSKDYIKASIVTLAFLGTLAIMNVSYYGFEHSRYQEQVYFSLSFIIALPFATYLLKSKSKKLRVVFYSVAIILISIRMYGIYSDSLNYKNRVAEIKTNIELARYNGGSKFVIDETQLKYHANWSYPIETMLLSSYDKELKSVTICTNEDFNFNENKLKLLPSQYLFRRWEIFDVESLNKNYFKIDKNDYSVINIK